ncbi:MAG: nitroreductase family protein [Anaerolineae bacterium]|nr:nitroreductase family protein [Anaerolineae bacterium]
MFASPILTRRMIRRYTSQPIPRLVLEQLLEAATRAPSPHNRQPWRFAVIAGEARTRLAQMMGDQLRRDLAADGVPTEVIEKDATRSFTRITSAQAGILVGLSMAEMDTYPDARRNTAEHWMAGQATAAAAQNILLRAAELGLGACWMCAPLFCPQQVVATLGLPWTGSRRH